MLNKEEAEKMKEEARMIMYVNDHGLIVKISDVDNIIDQFTEQEPDDPFDIPVMQVFRNSNGELDFAITGGEVEDWHLAIATNAAAICEDCKECKWVACDKKVGATFWENKPLFYENQEWWNDDGPIRAQYVYLSLIPADCSRAIVRIEHHD